MYCNSTWKYMYVIINRVIFWDTWGCDLMFLSSVYTKTPGAIDRKATTIIVTYAKRHKTPAMSHTNKPISLVTFDVTWLWQFGHFILTGWSPTTDVCVVTTVVVAAAGCTTVTFPWPGRTNKVTQNKMQKNTLEPLQNTLPLSSPSYEGNINKTRLSRYTYQHMQFVLCLDILTSDGSLRQGCMCFL